MKIKKEQQVREKGITLIALVITIIVLLILAGVSIAMLTGENGILSQAQNAKNKTNEAAKNEQLDLAKLEDLINETLNGVEVEQVTDNNPGVLEENGTEYTINSIEDLVVFAHNVKEGNTYSGKTVKLGLSLDFNSTKSYVDPFSTNYGEYGYNGELKTLLTSGEGFIPIGVGYDEEGTNSFSGSFDGQGNQIRNLYINEKDETNDKIGLFAVNYGNIENLNIVDVNITRYEETGNLTGGIAGQNRANATIKNCGVSGNIKIEGVGSAAGLVSSNLGSIEECYNLATIKIESSENELEDVTIGGITNNSRGSIVKCFNIGKLELILNGNLTQRTIVCAGGISSSSTNIIKESYNLGNIKVEFMGNGEQTVEVEVGGVTGASDYEISNCYNIGDIEATSNKGILSVGGIVGKTLSGTEGIQKNCYNVGNIQGICEESLYIGGIASTLNTNINNCYYLNQENFTNTGTGAGTVKTEDEMKGQSFVDLLNSGNTEVVWKYDVNENNGYPILSWQ